MICSLLSNKPNYVNPQKKSPLTGGATQDYSCPMTVVEAPKTDGHGPRVWPLTVNAYHALGDLGLIPEKTELLYGQVFYKMPKSPFHRLLLMRLLELLQRLLPPGLHVQPEQPILCGDSEPEPDLSVICGSINDYQTEHPRTAELVIEVCVSSHDFDRSKLRAYARAGVKECWLVLGPERQIEVHVHPAGEQFAERTVHGPGGRLTSEAVPGFTVDLHHLFTL
jgi:Uma2 family endonuclease